MFIKRLEVQNFKSFDHLEVELNDLNILVGANASGKSNFIQIFEFLRNISRYGLRDAISMEGGVEYLRNMSIGNRKSSYFKLVYDSNFRQIIEHNDSLIGVQLDEAVYEFELQFHKRGKGFSIHKDRLELRYEFVKLEETNNEVRELDVIGQGNILYSVSREKLRITSNLPKSIPISIEELSPLSSIPSSRANLPKKSLFFETPYFGLTQHWPYINDFSDGIAIYNFEPKLSQMSVPITGKTELEENGSNLSIVLREILADKEKKRKFLNLTGDLLPFVDDYKVQPQTDKSLLFTLREKYEESAYLPAFLLSDGTVNLTALIIALFFEQKRLVILEEPERTIHPKLISRFVQLLTEVATDKQIIITTHNPEIVRHASVNDLLLISRNKDGFSEISRPIEEESVNIFLSNEIGIEDLYVQDLLGV